MNRNITLSLGRLDTFDIVSGNGNRYILTLGEFEDVVQIDGEPEALLAIADCINKIVPRWEDQSRKVAEVAA